MSRVVAAYAYECDICGNEIPEDNVYDSESDWHGCDECAQDIVDYVREHNKELFKKVVRAVKAEWGE